MLGPVKTKKPRTSLARLLPFAAVVVLVGILYVFGDSLSKSVLDASTSLKVEQPTSEPIDNGIPDVDMAFETRVKSYVIDSKSAVDARLRADREMAQEEKEKEAKEKAERGKERAKIEAEEKRLAEIFSSQPHLDDGEEAYEFEDYGDGGHAGNESKADSDVGAWDKNQKTLVDADYGDYDDYDQHGSDQENKGDSSSKTSVAQADEDYDDDEMMGVSNASSSSKNSVGDFEDLGDGEAFLKAMENCNDLICIQEAHAKYSRAEDMFNFPHFMIIGFQKAATTSLKKYLERHTQIDKPRVKEPNFFPKDCHEKPPEQCSEKNTTTYINSILHKPKYIEQRGRLACMEASTHIVRAGHNLAPRMAKLMPWLKIIVQFREPISRAASMLIHNKDVNDIGCLTRSPMAHCLLHHSQLTEMQKNKYEPLTYTEAIQPWIENFPKEQIHVIQYETLIDPEKEASELMRVKKFLGVDERRPKGGLEVFNARRFSISPEGWKVRKSDYEELISLVEPDTKSLVDLLYDHELLADKQGWVKQWRAHWESNLATCGDDNTCVMSLS